MPEILAPCFVFFGGLADFLAELNKGVSKAVRVEIWQASSGENIIFLKNL